MPWFWDEEEKEEICYSEDGVEFMRYKPSTGMYRPPYLERVPIVGQIAMLGEVIPHWDGPVPSLASLDRIPKGTVPKQRQEGTTAGY